LVLAAVAWRAVPSYDGDPAPADRAGQALIVLLLGGLVVLVHDHAELTRTGALATGAGLVALAVLFVRVEGRAASPLLPPRVLRDRAFTATAAATVAGTGAFFGALYLVTVGLQDTMGLSALEAGAAVLPVAAGSAVTAVLAGRCIAAVGVRATMLAGSTLLVLAALPLPLAYGSYPAMLAPLVVLGVGWGLLVPTTSLAALHRVDATKQGVASGVTAGGRELGAALAAASLLVLEPRIGLVVAAAAGVIALVVVAVAVRDVEGSGHLPG
jgi:DHA2 family methylenomycin A resistance protein-like MFS transporter